MNRYTVMPMLLSSISLLCLRPPIMAQTHQATFPLASHGILHGQSLERTMEFIPPDLGDQGTPGGLRGASTRGHCRNVTLAALVPVLPVPASTHRLDKQLDSDNELVLSFTTQARPTFWFYVSQNLDVLPMEFVLKDDDHNELIRTPLSDSSYDQGIIQISLPESVSDLELSTRYHWFLEVLCDVSTVYGQIERIPIDPSLSLQLADASPRDQAAIYANNGIWQEAVTLLGKLYQANPGNTSLADDWYRLLESVDLEDLAQQPLIDCCTLEAAP